LPIPQLWLNGRKTKILTNEKVFYQIKVKPEVSKIGIYTLSNAILEEQIYGRTSITFSGIKTPYLFG
jgi:hypothetical protein